MKTNKTIVASLKKQLGTAGCLGALLIATGCSSVPPTPLTASTLQTVCASIDLTQYNQRQLLATGFRAIENNDLVCAERLTWKAHQMDVKDPFAALNLGAIYQRTNRLSLAKTMYEQVIALDSVDTDSRSKTAVEVTAEKAKDKRPSEIAKTNLALLVQ